MKIKKIIFSIALPFSFITHAQLPNNGDYNPYFQLNLGVSHIESENANSRNYYPVLGFDYQLYDKKTKAGINLVGDRLIQGYLTYDLFSYGSYGTKFKSSLDYALTETDADISLTPSLGITAFYNINNKFKINVGYDYGVGGDRIASAFLTYRFGIDDYYSFSISKITNEKITYIKKVPVEKVILRDSATELFAFDSYELTHKGKRAISDFIKRIELDRVKMIYISGHTDKKGSESYNWELSRKRAREVYHELLKNTGIDQGKVNYYGLGETSPVSDNMDDNRRVEILVQYETTLEP